MMRVLVIAAVFKYTVLFRLTPRRTYYIITVRDDYLTAKMTFVTDACVCDCSGFQIHCTVQANTQTHILYYYSA